MSLVIDGFSLQPFVASLASLLVGGRIDRITQPGKRSVILLIRQPGRSHQLHININPQSPLVYLTERQFPNPTLPPLFCMVLRKQIEGGRISSFRQVGLDRILAIDIDFLGAKSEIITKTLLIELIGKQSNIILLQDGIVVDAFRKVGQTSSRVREILPGKPYAAPAAQDKSKLSELTPEDLRARLSAQKEQRLSKGLLSIVLGFGPVSVKEAVRRAGLADTTIGYVSDDMVQRLYDALQSIAADIKNDISGYITLSPAGKVLSVSTYPIAEPVDGELRVFPTVSEMIEYGADAADSYTPPEKEQYRKLLRTELSRAENKHKVLQEEIELAQNAEDFKIRGDILMTYGFSLKDHENSEVTLHNIYSETGETVTIPLDQRLTVKDNIQLLYKKYDKLKRAQNLLMEQLARCEENIRYLSSIETSLAASKDPSDIADIKEELIRAGLLLENRKKHRQEKPSLPYSFHTKSGIEILVGKNNTQNDRLTFHTADASDMWLHTKDIPGSHVIVRLQGAEIDDDTLETAAEIAAYFSKGKDSSSVPVDYVLRRYVKKPSGAKPGFVIFTRQKTLYVTPVWEELSKKLAEELPHIQ
ncbi:tRNA modification protein RqcH [Selenomonas sp. TAMA-11512]|uniref:Rqc2 family fibronectin-binding protein n=1 Tax=Selenomonas sp. TAMA-11512 TaxID=3095337 RepID=UPI00308A602E|nr:tRNA modification protein RqcH [Selenomonas sp. TAMA-11512]